MYMSKSICGSRYTLNIENLNLLDLNVRKLTASTDITGSYLTASRVVATDANKKLVSSDITTTELNYLDGVSSAIQTQINSKQATIVAGTNLSFDGATLNAAAATITANRLAVSNGSGAIIASAVTDTEAGYLDGVSSAIQTQLNAKQATIGNSLSTSNTFTLVVGSISPKTTTFESDGDFISGGNVTDATGNVLSAKQGTIGDGDLTIARTSGLQSALDAKQATIDSSNRLSAEKISSGIVTNAEFNQIHNINTVSIPNGGVGTVQDQLDARQLTITATTKIPKPLLVNTAQSLSSPMNDISKIANTVVCLINVGGSIPTSANQTTTAGYYIDCYSAPNFETLNGLKNTGLVDSSIFTIVAPTYTTATTVSAHTGTDARFGVRILSAGLYRANYIVAMENESTNDRVSLQSYFRVLFTDSGGTERAEVLNSSLSTEYTRDDNFGQYATMTGTAYFEITNDMATNERGCFLKLNMFCRVGSGESFNSNPNTLIPRRGSLECEKIAELAS